MRKKAYKPNTVVLNLKDDLGLLEHDVNVEFWKDPSRSVLFTLLRIMRTDTEGLTSEELIQLNKDYFECAALMLIDCEIDFVDFSTPESTEAAFKDKRLPWGIFHQAMIAYVSKLSDEYQVLKNVLRRVLELSNSGTSKNHAENE